MKKSLLALLKTEVDPFSLVMVLAVLCSLIVFIKVLSDKIFTVDDYAMDDTEMFLPAL
jgi:hypothetical protein